MACQLVKAVIDNSIIISAVETKEIVNKAIKIHGLSPVAAAAMGRALTMAALMGKNLKNSDDYLTATINGGGSLGTITVCADAQGNIKGTVDNPVAQSIYKADGQLDVGAAVGNNGKITVIKDIGLKQPYIGTSEIVSGEIAADFAQYFALSEQQPCGITLGVSLDNKFCRAAGGVFVQVMPNCDKNLLSQIETVMYAMDEMSYQFDGSTARQVVDRFFANFSPVYTEQCDVRYKCNCNKRRIDRVIKSLGLTEAQQIVKEQGEIEVKCHFCNKKYIYDSVAVQKLFGTKEGK